MRFLERLRRRRLDAEEHRGEPCADHGVDQLGLGGEVDARLRVELEGKPVLALPLVQMREHPGDRDAVADEVVVDEEEAAPVAGGAERVELLEHLRGRLRTWLAAEDLDDVAELALERAAARVLHAHRCVVAVIDQVEAGRRDDLHRRPLFGLG